MKKPYFRVEKFYQGDYIAVLEYVPMVFDSYRYMINLINERQAFLTDLIILTDDRNQTVRYYKKKKRSGI